jgi:hypothetical protein
MGVIIEFMIGYMNECVIGYIFGCINSPLIDTYLDA